MTRKTGYMRTTTALFIAAMAVAVGFFLGISVPRGGTPVAPATTQAQAPASMPPASGQQSSTAGLTPSETSRLLDLEKKANMNKDNFKAWVDLGNFYFDHAMSAKAVAAYEKALAINPLDPNVWTDLGVMFRRTDQPEKAIEAFNRAIDINATHKIARFNKGIVLLHDLNDKDGALAAWQSLLDVDPNAKAPNGQPLKDLMQKVREGGL